MYHGEVHKVCWGMWMTSEEMNNTLCNLSHKEHTPMFRIQLKSWKIMFKEEKKRADGIFKFSHKGKR